jgi:hypothetical protein
MLQPRDFLIGLLVVVAGILLIPIVFLGIKILLFLFIPVIVVLLAIIGIAFIGRLVRILLKKQ